MASGLERLTTILRSLLALAACAGVLSSPNAVVAAVSTLINNGPSTNRVDIVFLGDGYTEVDLALGLYDQHIQSYVGYMFGPAPLQFLNDPFDRYAKFFNVHKVDVVSAQSGADKPSQGVFVNTALDATYETSGVDRLLTINDFKADQTLSQNLAGTGLTADIRLAVVNDAKYGGAGGMWGVFAGGNASAQEIALHELGHSFSNLADEYADLSGPYSGIEPSEPNATKDPNGAKWSQWIGFDDPRGWNLDISSFQGAHRFPSGVYRPSSNSKMRTLGQPFDAVSREAIILDIYDSVQPLDGWLDNAATIVNAPLWVDLVDPLVQAVQWFVDGGLVPGATAAMFDPTAFGIDLGSHTVSARAYDTVLDHVGDGGMLDLVRKDLSRLEQSVTWSLTLTAPVPAPGDFNNDGFVDREDLLGWQEGYGVDGSAQRGDGDADGDADVDGADFLAWQQNVRPSLDAPLAGRVPEPGGAHVTIIAATLTAAWRAVRRSRISFLAKHFARRAAVV